MNAEIGCSERDSGTRSIAIDSYNVSTVCVCVRLSNTRLIFVRVASAPCVF